MKIWYYDTLVHDLLPSLATCNMHLWCLCLVQFISYISFMFLIFLKNLWSLRLLLALNPVQGEEIFSFFNLLLFSFRCCHKSAFLIIYPSGLGYNASHMGCKSCKSSISCRWKITGMLNFHLPFVSFSVPLLLIFCDRLYACRSRATRINTDSLLMIASYVLWECEIKCREYVQQFHLFTVMLQDETLFHS